MKSKYLLGVGFFDLFAGAIQFIGEVDTLNVLIAITCLTLAGVIFLLFFWVNINEK